MSTIIERPTFYEGQLLGAADLQLSLDYSRDQHARHARHAHTWGIVRGLNLAKRGNTAIEVQPGVAIDSSGAEIVVSASVTLDPSLFTADLGSQAKDESYPVFIARTSRPGASSQLLGQCGTPGHTRVNESFTFRFQHSAVDWDDQDEPSLEAGADDAEESSRLVLLGFVTWNLATGKLVDFLQSKDGLRPRYVGTRADQVVASNGQLQLRSQHSRTANAPMLVLDKSREDQVFVVGVDKGDGTAKPLLSVDSKGNVTASGTIRGSAAPGVGQVLIQSGVAFDGVLLPLPRTITEETVTTGGVTVHSSVTPRIDWSAQPAPDWGPFVLQCEVDGDRRVKCQIRWMRLGANSSGSIDVAGAVDYTVIATIPPKGGAS